MTVVPFEKPAAAGLELAARDTVDGWVEMIRPVAALAAEIANTPFVPVAYQGKAAAITAAILAGRELGLGPMQSLQHIHVIDGRPAVSAEIARGLALAQGHEIIVTDTSITRCVVRGRRRGSSEWVTVSWSIDDAKRAGIDGKQNWRKHPRRMLQARATSELCHLLFADAIGGMPFTVEEAQDDTDIAGHVNENPDVGEQAPPAAPGRRTAQRKARPVATPKPAEPAPQAVDEPPLPGEPGYDEPAEQGVLGESVTAPQLTKLHTVLTENGIADREEKLDIARRIIRRQIDSSKDLTKDEATVLIDTLERAGQHPAGFSGFLSELLAVTEGS
jgi:hypothetical protein